MIVSVKQIGLPEPEPVAGKEDTTVTEAADTTTKQ